MATPAPEKLTTLQVESFTDLIQTNPVDWQGKIKVVKEDFPEDFASTIGLDTDLLDNSQFDNYYYYYF